MEYCGYEVSTEGYTVSDRLVKSLENFPVPKNKTDLRAFLGLANQFEMFSSKLAHYSTPLRHITSVKATFVWDEPQKQAFGKIKRLLTNKHFLAHFEQEADHRLETDAAQSKGLGFLLWQKSKGDESWKLLQCGSRCLTDSESRYSATEIEMLAVYWAVKKCRAYLQGLEFEVIVDHKALLPLLNSKHLDEIENPRLQRLREKLGSYQFIVSWRKGQSHQAADSLSRYPTDNPTDEDFQLNNELCYELHQINSLVLERESFCDRATQDPLYESIKNETLKDPVARKLTQVIMNGFPEEKRHLDEELHPFWKNRDLLSLNKGIILCGKRIFVPKSLRQKTLNNIHKSHLGLERSMRKIRSTIYYPGIENDMKNVINSCEPCRINAPSRKLEDQCLKSRANYPFELVHVDLCYFSSKYYLVMVDNVSNWVTVASSGTKDFTSESVVSQMTSWFATYGIPKRIVSDGGPQFKSERFEAMCAKWNIYHSVSSPYNPRSNGKAEAAVKTIKNLMKKCDCNGNIMAETFKAGLLEHRSTPGGDGKSPAEIVYGREIRTLVPNFAHMDSIDSDNKERAIAENQYFKIGDKVRVQHPITKTWQLVGKVIGQKNNRASFFVECDDGKVIWRNQRFLRKIAQDKEQGNGSVDDTIETEPVQHSIVVEPGSNISRSQTENRRDIIPRRRGERQKRMPAHLKDYLCQAVSILYRISTDKRGCSI